MKREELINENMIENLQHLQLNDAFLTSNQVQLQYELTNYLFEVDYYFANDDFYSANLN